MRRKPAAEAAPSDYGRCQQVIRIVRLMQMVQHRTYLPPLTHLASHLGVCTRTVRRDLDVLRSVGITLPGHVVADRTLARTTRNGALVVAFVNQRRAATLTDTATTAPPLPPVAAKAAELARLMPAGMGLFETIFDDLLTTARAQAGAR